MEVSRSTLKSLAGWAIANVGPGGPKDEALLKLRDGCTAAMEFIPDSAPTLPPADPSPPAVQSRPSSRGGECDHRFHIRTQRCIYCDQTYRAVKDREPEFIGR